MKKIILLIGIILVTVLAKSQPATVPYECGFDNSTENAKWTLANGTQANKWQIGNTTSGSYVVNDGLYISNNGTANQYTNTTSYVYAYREITLAAGNYYVNYDWRANGENAYDVLMVFLVPNSVTTLTGGNANGLTGSNITSTATNTWKKLYDGSPLYSKTTWHEVRDKQISISPSEAGTWKLVFFWKNDNLNLYQPPAAIKNIKIVSADEQNCDPRVIGSAFQGTYSLPTSTYRNYSYVQQIYRSIEINKPVGTKITTLSFQYFFGTAQSVPVSAVIYLKNTTKASFTSTAKANWEPTSTMTKVFEGTINFNNSGTANWVTINLDTPFEYTGDNIVIAFRNRRGNANTGSNSTFYSTTTAFNSSLFYYGINVDLDPTDPSDFRDADEIFNYRSNIKFNFESLQVPAVPTISADTTICFGSQATLTATSESQNIKWYDSEIGGNLLYSGTNYIVNPSTTTTYWAETASPCGNSARTPVTVTVLSPPTVTINLQTPTIQQYGNTTISTISIIGGVGNITYQWQYSFDSVWFNLSNMSQFAGVNTANLTINNINILGTIKFRLKVSMSGNHCYSNISNEVTLTVNPVSNPQSNYSICGDIYVSSVFGSDTYSGTPDFPVKTIQKALTLVTNSRFHIKIQEGNYSENNTINLENNVILDGAYFVENGIWKKGNSSINTTTITRTAANYLGNYRAKRLSAFEGNGISNFVLQDLKIITENAEQLQESDYGVSNYVIALSNCENYTINRCELIAGNASSGKTVPINFSPTTAELAGTNGSAPPAGSNNCMTANSNGGNGGGSLLTEIERKGGKGGFGGHGGGPLIGEPDPEHGEAGHAGGGGTVGGSGGNRGCCGNLTNGSNGTAGYAGTNGNGFLGNETPTYTYSTFFVPSDFGRTGKAGTGGSGGGGGGGGDYGSSGILIPTYYRGNIGGAGGGGGAGGAGGKGGSGGGASFGIYVYNSSTSANILNNNIITGTAGTGGIGQDGQEGGAGGSGSNGNSTSGNCNGPKGGNGAAGGKGGNGAKGEDGQAGVAHQIVHVSTSGVATPANNQTAIPTTPLVSANNANRSNCANSQIEITKNSGTFSGSGINFVKDKTPTTSSYNASSTTAKIYYSTIGKYQPISNSPHLFITKDRTLGTISGNTTISQNSTETYTYNGSNYTKLDWEIHDNNGNLISNSQFTSTTSNQFQYNFNNTGIYHIRLIETSECCGVSIPIWLTVAYADSVAIANIPRVTLIASQQNQRLLWGTDLISQTVEGAQSYEFHIFTEDSIINRYYTKNSVRLEFMDTNKQRNRKKCKNNT